MNTIASTEIHSLLLSAEAGSQANYYRPYELNLNQSTTANYLETVNQNKPLTPIGINNLFQDAISTAAPIYESAIPFGWNSMRYKFVLRIAFTTVEGITIKNELQGYTDSYDPSIQGTLDPNMRFYINNSNSWTVSKNSAMAVHTDSDKMIIPPTYMESGGTNIPVSSANDPATLATQRPVDVMREIAVSRRQDNFIQEDNTFIDKDLVINSSSDVRVAEVSSAKWNNPLSYMGATIGAYQSALDISEHFGTTSAIDTAYDAVSENAVFENPLISYLRAHTNASSAEQSASFTTSDLSNIDPELLRSNRVEVFNNPEVHMESESLQDASVTSNIAHLTQSMLLSVMANLGVCSWSGMFSNMTMAQPDYTQVSPGDKYIVATSHLSGNGVVKQPLNELQTSMENYIRTILIPFLGKNMYQFTITVNADTYTTTTVTVEVDGFNTMNPTPYTYASYADGAYASTIRIDNVRNDGRQIYQPVSEGMDLLFTLTDSHRSADVDYTTDVPY